MELSQDGLADLCFLLPLALSLFGLTRGMHIGNIELSAIQRGVVGAQAAELIDLSGY